MRKLIYLVLTLLMISIGSVLAADQNAVVNQGASAPASQTNGDTYNFYFQKAPGPTTVNQGTSGAPPASAPAAAPATAPAPAAEESDVPATTSRVQSGEVVKERIPRWSFALLYGGFKDEARLSNTPSMGLSFDFRFNKMIGLTTGIIKGFTKSYDTVSTDAFFGAKFMPLNVSMGTDGSFEFGLGVGLMTSDYIESTSSSSSYDWFSGSWSSSPSRSYATSKIVFYAGPQMNIMFNRNFGLTAETRFASSKNQQYGAGLMFRF